MRGLVGVWGTVFVRTTDNRAVGSSLESESV